MLPSTKAPWGLIRWGNICKNDFLCRGYFEGGLFGSAGIFKDLRYRTTSYITFKSLNKKCPQNCTASPPNQNKRIPVLLYTIVNAEFYANLCQNHEIYEISCLFILNFKLFSATQSMQANLNSISMVRGPKGKEILTVNVHANKLCKFWLVVNICKYFLKDKTYKKTLFCSKKLRNFILIPHSVTICYKNLTHICST